MEIQKKSRESYDGSIFDTIATTTASTNIERSLPNVKEKEEIEKNFPSKPEVTKEEPDVINTWNKISSSTKVKAKNKLTSKSDEYDIGAC